MTPLARIPPPCVEVHEYTDHWRNAVRESRLEIGDAFGLTARVHRLTRIAGWLLVTVAVTAAVYLAVAP